MCTATASYTWDDPITVHHTGRARRHMPTGKGQPAGHKPPPECGMPVHRRPRPGEEEDRCACDRLLAGPTGLAAASRAHHSTSPNPHQTMPSGVVRACPSRRYGALPSGEEFSSSGLRFTVPRVAPYIPLERQDRTRHNSIIDVRCR